MWCSHHPLHPALIRCSKAVEAVSEEIESSTLQPASLQGVGVMQSWE